MRLARPRAVLHPAIATALALDEALARAAALALLCGGAAACSGSHGAGAPDSASGDGGSCPLPAACGGDVVGTWNLTGGCVASSPSTGCAQANVSAAVQASGTITFENDGGLETNTLTALTATLGLPPECLGGKDCAALETQLAQEGQAQSGGGSVSCTGSSSSGCTCTQTFAPNSTQSSGSYAVSGTSLTSGPGAFSEAYCVQGDTLRWISPNADGFVYVFTATK